MGFNMSINLVDLPQEFSFCTFHTLEPSISRSNLHNTGDLIGKDHEIISIGEIHVTKIELPLGRQAVTIRMDLKLNTKKLKKP